MQTLAKKSFRWWYCSS